MNTPKNALWGGRPAAEAAKLLFRALSDFVAKTGGTPAPHITAVSCWSIMRTTT